MEKFYPFDHKGAIRYKPCYGIMDWLVPGMRVKWIDHQTGMPFQGIISKAPGTGGYDKEEFEAYRLFSNMTFEGFLQAREPYCISIHNTGLSHSGTWNPRWTARLPYSEAEGRLCWEEVGQKIYEWTRADGPVGEVEPGCLRVAEQIEDKLGFHPETDNELAKSAGLSKADREDCGRFLTDDVGALVIDAAIHILIEQRMLKKEIGAREAGRGWKRPQPALFRTWWHPYQLKEGTQAHAQPQVVVLMPASFAQERVVGGMARRYCDSFEMIGGHSAADYTSVLERTRPATLDEMSLSWWQLRDYYEYSLLWRHTREVQDIMEFEETYRIHMNRQGVTA